MRLALTPSARAWTSDARVEIAARLVGEPIAQAPRSVLGAAADAQLGQALPCACARTTPPAARLPVNASAVEFAAQRHQRAVGERHRLRKAVEALAHPLDVAIEEGAGFAEIALHGKRDDDRAACAADAQRQAARARMSSHLNRAIELFDARTLQCLPPKRSAATDLPPRAITRRWSEQPTEADAQHAAIGGRLLT